MFVVKSVFIHVQGVSMNVWIMLQAKVVMKNGNVAARLQDIVSEQGTGEGKLQETSLADINAVIATVSE